MSPARFSFQSIASIVYWSVRNSCFTKEEERIELRCVCLIDPDHVDLHVALRPLPISVATLNLRDAIV